MSPPEEQLCFDFSGGEPEGQPAISDDHERDQAHSVNEQELSAQIAETQQQIDNLVDASNDYQNQPMIDLLVGTRDKMIRELEQLQITEN